MKIRFFLLKGQKNALALGRSLLQEVQISPRSGLYLLIDLTEEEKNYKEYWPFIGCSEGGRASQLLLYQLFYLQK